MSNNPEMRVFTLRDIDFDIRDDRLDDKTIVQSVNGETPDENGNVQVVADNGIYTGSDTPPDTAVVWIDPNGEASNSTVELYNADPLAHPDIREEINQLSSAKTELQTSVDEIKSRVETLENSQSGTPEITVTENASGYWYNNDGVPTFYVPSNSDACSKETNYIECKEGDKFKITLRSSSGHEANGGWYDSNKNLISIILVDAGGHQVETTTTVTAPAGTAYVRFFSLSWSGDLTHVPLDVVYLGQESEISTVATSPLKGKKIVYDGDSICSSWGTSRNGGAYPKIIADIVEGEYDNQGVGGGRIVTAEGSSDTFHSIVDNIVNLPTDGDLYCFEGGVNDHWHGVPLGTFSESDYTEELDKTTFCGALETIFRYAITHFVGKPICYIVVHKCPSSAFSSGYYGSSDTFADFRDKALGICEKYSIPVYDAWKDSGINSWNASQLANYFIVSESTGTGDGTHPNEQGYRRYYVPQLIDLFERIMPIGATSPDEPLSSNVLETVGYLANKHLSKGTGSVSDNEGTCVTGQIPVSVGDTIYMQNITISDTLDSTNVYRNQVGGYKADGSWVFVKNLVGDTIDFNIQSSGGNITQFTIPSDLLGGDTKGFIRISATNIDETSIITKNEPID